MTEKAHVYLMVAIDTEPREVPPAQSPRWALAEWLRLTFFELRLLGQKA